MRNQLVGRQLQALQPNHTCKACACVVDPLEPPALLVLPHPTNPNPNIHFSRAAPRPQLPAKFKSGPLNEQLGELVVLYFAFWQGAEGARRSYYRQVRSLGGWVAS
jgi:hypothetical protein